MKQNLSGLIQFAKDDTQAATLSGSIYRKQIAKFGDWVNPQYPSLSSKPIMTLDEEWARTIVRNFENNTLGAPVPVPLNHTNEVEANTGRVQSLEIVPGDGLYGYLALNSAATEKIDEGTIFDVSISFDWNHIRTDDNKNYGPTLLHCALVNNPYLLEMNGFEKVGPALSRLEESLSSVGLSRPSTDVIMLSTERIKELSAMATATIKNDKPFAITVKYKDEDGTEQEVVVEPNEEIVVPEDASEEVTTQIADAQDADDDKGEDDTAGGDAGEDGAGEDEGNQGEDEGEKEELSRLRQENAELKLSKTFDELLSKGKVIPAQRDKFMALSKISGGVQLSKDGSQDIVSVVLDLLGTGAPQFSTDENGSSEKGEGDKGNAIAGAAPAQQNQNNEGKKPSELLTEEELAGMKAVGADPSKLDEYAEKDPVFADALASLSK